MTKAELRKQAISFRKSLTKADVAHLSRKLLDNFKKLDFLSVQSIHVFLPIEEKGEPDTFLLIEWLKQNYPDIKIIVPKADFKSLQMTHHVLTDHADLQKNIFNILEPQESALHSGDIDMVIVPLLAFDLAGYRVGYGKGFYDRFLRGIQTFKVGLSLSEPVDRISDVDAYDIPLDCCITPSACYDFQA
jgi:5-formyltetrahydrofolate cyclo-ligase